MDGKRIGGMLEILDVYSYVPEDNMKSQLYLLITTFDANISAYSEDFLHCHMRFGKLF